ncbi:MAG: hypothetical protein HKN96_06620 [Flavobacteriaceae bacterium]|nr:hypothetical protein [Flavobacteriaceae bacterium]
MSQNKTGKYLKYAIGEIILVVFGILIALQVSNWNEVRKSNLKTEALLDKFEDELVLTIKNANHDIKNSIIGDSVMKRVLKNKVTRQDYINDDQLRTLITWRFTLNPELDNLEKLVEKEEELGDDYNEVIHLINRFSYIREREVDAMNLLRLSSEENSDFISLNFPWARLSDSLSNEAAYQYFLTDENYKNRLYAHWKKCMNYNRIIMNYRTQMLEILSKLKIIREAYTPTQLEDLFKNLEQKPFERIEANKSMNDIYPDDQLAKSSLIANFTKDTLQIIIKNKKGDELNSYEARPGRIFTTRTSRTDLYSDNLKIIEVYKNGICIEKYKEVQYGYLILK